MKVRALRANDLGGLCSLTQALALESMEHSYSIVRENGEVVLCGGIIPYWEGRGEAWVKIRSLSKSEAATVIRIMRRYFKKPPLRRVEIGVAVDNKAGHRLARLLGFHCEAERARAYLPDGRDCSLYSKVSV